jgi:hypothetical protein
MAFLNAALPLEAMLTQLITLKLSYYTPYYTLITLKLLYYLANAALTLKLSYYLAKRSSSH